MHDADIRQVEPSLADSLVRIFEAGQRVVLDRLDLAYFDLSQLAVRTLHGAGLIAVGSVLLTGAWLTLIAGVVVWLQPYMTLAASLIIVAAVNAALGAVAIAIGLRRAQTAAAAKLGDMVEDLRGRSNGAAAGERSSP